MTKFSAFLWFAPLQNKRNFANQKQQYRKGKSRRWWQNDMGIWISMSWCLGYGCHWVQQPLLLGIKNTSRQLKSWPQDGTMLGKIIAECLVQALNPGLISIFELKLELKGVRPLVTRGGREIIFLCYWPEHGCSILSESSHALISPRCGDSSPHLPLYPPPLSIVSEEKTEQDLQSMTGRGHRILTSRVAL